jgi:hypothetical protein
MRSVKHKLPKTSEIEKHTLTVTTENIETTKLSIPVFINSLQPLHDKGYLIAVSIYEKEYHEKIREYATDVKEEEVLKLLKEKGLTEFPLEAKKVFADIVEKMIPTNANVDFDRQSILNEKLTFEEYLNDTRQLRANHKDTDVSIVLLSPFRDINKLLEKMNSGKTFDEIQDSSIWYDSKKYQFHIGKEVVATSYQGKANVEHYILELLPENLKDGVIGFDQVDEYKSVPLRNNLNKFVKKNERLPQIFKVYKDRLEFDKKAFE